ncbi:MAG: 30S ribosomal protein S3 [Acidimicrobiia bacterium]|nr:MAG: 30S ribosomal protein S3 [Acidimicrobiia bacterium]
MGQKTHPYAFRLGIVTDWKSRWYSDDNYAALAIQDSAIRDYLNGELERGAISRIEVERLRDKIVVEVFTARPGVVIGRRGSEAERLRAGLEKLSGLNVKLNVTEIKDADTDATILAKGIADQIANRVAFRRAMKRAVQAAMKAGAEGVRVECKGRLGGADMGRREWYREGRVPLHTLRADVDYGTATARTTVGAIGVKVWVYKGDVVGARAALRERKIQAEAELATGGGRGRVASPKSRAEQAVDGDRMPRIIEAGGGKRKETRTGEESESRHRRSREEAEELDLTEETPGAEVETSDEPVAESTSGDAAETPEAAAEAADVAVEAETEADAEAGQEEE